MKKNYTLNFSTSFRFVDVKMNSKIQLIATVLALVVALANYSSSQEYRPPPPTSTTTEKSSDCICTLEYNPVCGTDGIVYGNPCQANCAGVGCCSNKPGSLGSSGTPCKCEDPKYKECPPKSRQN